MAIIIPSKNIYDIDNPKIRNNIIDKVSVEQKVISAQNGYDENVHTSEFYNITKDTLYTFKNKNRDSALISGNVYNIAIATTEVASWTTALNIKIPVINNNHFVETLKLGADLEGNSNIGIRLYGSVSKAKISAKFDVTGLGDDAYEISDREIVEITSEKISFNIPTIIENKKNYGGALALAKADASIEIKDPNATVLTELSQPSISIDKNTGIEYYEFNINVISAIEVEKVNLGGVFLYQANAENKYEINDGEYEALTAEKIEITFYGNTIGININDGTISYGNGENPYSIENNELIQRGATTFDGADAIEYISNNILREYKNGKETATLLCDINEYKDDNGDLAVSEKKVSHNIIPYPYYNYKPNTQIEKNGLTFEYREGGAVFINGLATNKTVFRIVNDGDIKLSSKTKVTVSGCPSGGSQSTYRIEVAYQNIDTVAEPDYASDTGKSYTISDVSGIYRVSIIVEQGTQMNNVVFKPMIVIGDKKKPYIKGSFSMTMNEHDIVTPMIPSSMGVDVPMSRYIDGTPKKFIVIGKSIINDGAVWQKIYLQEV